MAKRPVLKDYHVNFKLVAEVAVRVSADSPENALIKGREMEARPGDFLDVDEVNVADAEVTGVWTVDD